MLKTDEYGSSYIDFVKMHGAGNDYIYIDAVSDPASMPDDPNTLSVKISDRHFGVGSDGLVVIMPSEVADFRMRMFNADGSEAQMCGNATRCIGKFVYDRGLTRKREVTLETLSGIKVLSLHVGDDDRVRSVTVDMGLPHVEGEVEMVSEGKTFRAVSVNVGNPHGVVFIDEAPDDALVLGHGRASAVAAVTTGRMKPPCFINLPGGTLSIDLDPATGHVILSGPAAFVAEGRFFLPK